MHSMFCGTTYSLRSLYVNIFEDQSNVLKNASSIILTTLIDGQSLNFQGCGSVGRPFTIGTATVNLGGLRIL